MAEGMFRSRLPEPTVRIFTDFDGTMTQEDVGRELFRHFCGQDVFDAVRRRWDDGELTAPEAYDALCRSIPFLREKQLQDFLEPYAVDPSFPRFAEWCARQGYPLLVLSDGADRYIDILLDSAGVDIPYVSNRMHLTDSHPVMEFPYFDPRCPQIANCKSNHVALTAQDDDTIVYIGDGTSDFEAAQYADMVFARGALERYCQEQNITFRRFYSFTTVREVLSHMISQNALRRRKRAEVRRRSLWSGG